jgi:TP901 family phage tail tape measure protein|tara:strand:- start:20135 stop:24091 length:3957 start_codon:yes stop_codon:yes gene_type:complete
MISGRIEAILELKNRMSAKFKKATQDAEKFQQRMDKIGQNATRVGGAMTAGITLPLTAIAVASVSAFSSFQKEMSGVQAVTQASGKDFQKLEGLATRMGESTVFTATQSAEAMKAFGLAGFETDEIMSALEPTLNLAAAGSMDMATAAGIAAKVTRGYGIEASGTTHAMDVLTKAFTTSNTNLEELGNSFKMVGPVAKTAGVSFEMTTAALQTMADAGITGSASGRQLRRAMLRLVDPPGEAAKALKKLRVETSTADGRMRPFDEIIQELEPHLQDTAAMAQIFGTVAMPGMVAILEKGSDELRNMTAALEDSDGTGKRIADVMLKNLSGAFTLLTSAMEGVWLAIGKQLEPILMTLMKVGTKLAHVFSREIIPAFATMDPGIKVVVVALLALLAAAGPVLMMFGLLAPTIPAIVGALGTIAGVLTGPVLLFGALATVIAVYISRSEMARKFVVALGRVLLSLAKVALKGLILGFNLALDALFAWWDFLFTALNFLTGGIVEKAFNALTGGLTWLADALGVAEEATEDTSQALDDCAVPVATVTDALDGLAGEIDDDVVPAVEDMTEAWEEIAKGWKTGAIPEAKNMMLALADVGGISRLTVAEQKALHSTIDTAIAKYKVLGQTAPQEMVRVWQATRRVGEETKQVVANIIGAISTLPTFAEAFPWLAEENQIKVTTSLDPNQIVGGIEPEGMVSVGQMMGSGLKRGFAAIVSGIPDTVIDAFKGGGGLFGAFQAIGAQAGAAFGGNTLGAIGAKLASKEGAGKMLKGFASMLGPIGAAVGSLAGPLIGGLKKLFSGPTVAESVRKAGGKMFAKGISQGLSEAIEATRESTQSDFGAMMMHMSDIIEEQGGVIAMGMEKAISSVRDIFSAVEQGGITTEQAAQTFGESFGKIASAMVESGGIATSKFTELITLAERFGTTGETIKFVGEQAKLASVGIAAMFGPTIEEAKGYNAAIAKNREEWEAMHPALDKALADYEKVFEAHKKGKASQDDLDEAGAKYNQTLERYEELAREKIELDEKLNKLASLSQEELEDLGTIAVASFESALAAGMSFTEAVEAHGPALDAIIDAQKELGIESDNAAIKELSHFQDRIRNNKGLVAGVEALDDTMLALSRTGSLNAETLGAMERQGSRMYDKLIEKGFTQEQAVLMMGPALKTIMEAHEKLGIPVDENTQRLIDQAKEAGVLETEQKSGWSAIETAVGNLISKMDTLIGRLTGVKNEADKIPKEINIAAHVSYTDSGIDTSGQHGLEFAAAHGGIVTRPSIGLVGEAGPEAIIPLSKLDSRDERLFREIRSLKSELRNLPLHLRDAILLAG